MAQGLLTYKNKKTAQKIERLEKESGQLKVQLSSHPDRVRLHFGMITHELQQLIQDL